MLFIYGDSHAYYNFRNIDLPHIFKHQPGTTLHRVGRDNNILHFDSSEHTGQDSLVFYIFGLKDGCVRYLFP